MGLRCTCRAASPREPGAGAGRLGVLGQAGLSRQVLWGGDCLYLGLAGVLMKWRDWKPPLMDTSGRRGTSEAKRVLDSQVCRCAGVQACR